LWTHLGNRKLGLRGGFSANYDCRSDGE